MLSQARAMSSHGYISAEQLKWSAVIKQAGIKID